MLAAAAGRDGAAVAAVRRLPYQTRFSGPLTRSFADLAGGLTGSLALGPDDLVYDIGSNDGTLLSFYPDLGVPVHGVDPSSAADAALQPRHPDDEGVPERRDRECPH